MNAWDTVLTCLLVGEDKNLAIDREAFGRKRYGFNPRDFKVDKPDEAD